MSKTFSNQTLYSLIWLITLGLILRLGLAVSTPEDWQSFYVSSTQLLLSALALCYLLRQPK